MVFSYDEVFESRLQELEKKHLTRTLRTTSSFQARYTKINQQNLLYFGSNSYLGLANDSRLLTAGKKALHKWGTGSGGSRLVGGNYAIHEALEKQIATLKKHQQALLFATGFQANVSVLTALLDREWVVFCDRLNHASLIDGIRFSQAEMVLYRHVDMDDLVQKITKYKGRKGMIVTDGVFSMDGDIAPLEKIVEIAHQYNLLTFVDDAHGNGVLGDNGGGTSELLKVKGEIDIEMGTFSKAFASEGGFITSRKVIIEYVKHFARGFMFSTAMPPHVAAISLEALKISQKEKWRRQKLHEISLFFREKLRQNNLPTKEGITPIVPFFVPNPETALSLSQWLRERGIFVPPIRPPAVKESRLRFSLMATHTHEDIEKVVDLLCWWRDRCQ